MAEDLERIEAVLAHLTKALSQQAKDITKLRKQLSQLVKHSTPTPVTALIEPDCEYSWMWTRIHLDAKTWSRVKAGEHVKVKGKGWVPEDTDLADPKHEDFHWDFWEFNGGIGKPMKVIMKSSRYKYDDPEDEIAFDGLLLKCYVQELGLG